MKKVYYFTLAAVFVAIAFGGAYLLCVGGAWIIKSLLALAFHTPIGVNVWWAGLALWLVLGTYVGIKNLINKK